MNLNFFLFNDQSVDILDSINKDQNFYDGLNVPTTAYTKYINTDTSTDNALFLSKFITTGSQSDYICNKLFDILNDNIPTNFVYNAVGNVKKYTIIDSGGIQIIRIPRFNQFNTIKSFDSYEDILIFNPYFVLFNSTISNWTENKDTLCSKYQNDPDNLAILNTIFNTQNKNGQLLIKFLINGYTSQTGFKNSYTVSDSNGKYYYCIGNLTELSAIDQPQSYSYELVATTDPADPNYKITICNGDCSPTSKLFDIYLQQYDNDKITGIVPITQAQVPYNIIQELSPYKINSQFCFNYYQKTPDNANFSRGIVESNGYCNLAYPYGDSNYAQLDAMIQNSNADYTNLNFDKLPYSIHDSVYSNHLVSTNSNYLITNTFPNNEPLANSNTLDSQKKNIAKRSIYFGTNDPNCTDAANCTDKTPYLALNTPGTYATMENIVRQIRQSNTNIQTLGIDGLFIDSNNKVQQKTTSNNYSNNTDDQNICQTKDSKYPINCDDLFKYIDTTFNKNLDNSFVNYTYDTTSGNLTSDISSQNMFLTTDAPSGKTITNYTWGGTPPTATGSKYQLVGDPSTARTTDSIPNSMNYFNTATKWKPPLNTIYTFESDFLTAEIPQNTTDTAFNGKDYCGGGDGVKLYSGGTF